MEPVWSNDDIDLYNSFKNLNLRGIRMQFNMVWGSCVDGKISSYNFDWENSCFIFLEDAIIDNKHFLRFNISGVDILVWRISPYQLKNDQSTFPTFESNKNSIELVSSIVFMYINVCANLFLFVF